MKMNRMMTAAVCAGLMMGMFSVAAQADDQYTLKMHLSVATGEPAYQAAEVFRDMVAEGTDGNVVVELYPSSSLGNAADCLEGLSMGTCDIVFDTIGNLASFSDFANVEAMPYMYNDVDHWRAVWEGELGDEIRAKLGEECDMEIMGAALMGKRILTTTTPVKTLEDLQGLKLRMPTISIYMDTWTWLGSNPVAIPGGELFTALQQGTAVGQDNPYPSSAGISVYDVCKYVTETNHVYNCMTFDMDKTFFDSLPEEYQTVIREAAAAAGPVCTDGILEQTEAKKQVFIDAGCEIYEINIEEWQAALDGFLEEKYPYLVEYAEKIKAAKPE